MLWGKREQAMYYDIDCYGAKALPLKYQITAHRPFMHGMYIRVCNSTVYKSAQ